LPGDGSTSGSRPIEASKAAFCCVRNTSTPARPLCANTGLSPTAWRTGQFNPERKYTFRMTADAPRRTPRAVMRVTDKLKNMRERLPGLGRRLNDSTTNLEG
jgi:uncharacterized protein (DUF2461 family)